MRKFPKISWPGATTALFYGPVSLLAAPTALETGQDMGLGFWIISGTATAITCVFIYLFSRLGRSWQRATSSFGLVILGLLVCVAGLARGLFLALALDYIDVNLSLSAVDWARNSMISTAFWVLAISSVQNHFERLRVGYQDNFAKRTLALAKSLQSKTSATPDMESLRNVKALQANLTQIASTARASGLSNQDLLLAADQIRSEIETSLRPLSHRIWFNEAKNQPQFRLNAVWLEGIKRLRLAPALLALLATLGLFLGASTYLPPIELISRSLAVGVLTLAAIIGLKRFLSNRSVSTIATLTLLFVSTFLPYLVTELLVRSLLPDWTLSRPELVLLPALGNAAAVLLISFSRQLESDWLLVTAHLAQSRPASSIQNLKLASYLHNSLQSELTQIAIKLEGGSGDEDKSNLLARLEEISKIEIDTELANTELKPLDRLIRVIEGWESIIEVRCQTEFLEKLPRDKQALVVAAIEEAISNAVRHAKAKWIEIGLLDAGKTKNLVIRNPVTTKATKEEGLGARLLGELAATPPRIRVSKGIRELSVQIQTQPE